MATVNATVTRNGDGSVLKFSFDALTTTNDNGAAIPFAEWADRSVQVTGTFGSGGTLKLQGSNDGGTTWVDLTDPQGNAISFTAAGLEAVTEVVELARPYVSAGDGSTDLDVFVLCRRPNNMRT
jgi:hypothetical protein